MMADVVNRQALKRRLTPEDTAAAVAFLVSDGATALTGLPLGGLIGPAVEAGPATPVEFP